MLDDGTLNITQKNDINITGDAKWTVNIKGDTGITVKGKTDITTTGNTTIKSNGNIVLDHGGKLQLGKGAVEKVVLGDTFMAFFNTHTHVGNLGAPTSPPIAPMSPAQLTKKNVLTL